MKNTKHENILPILAIETSGNLCSVAVLLNEDIYSECNVNKKNIHSEILFELINNSLSKLSLTINDINSIAISEGPGSFTGLRIGMAAGKGIADGSGLPIIAVPTFKALAFQISNYVADNMKFCIANKANRDEFYFAVYQKLEGEISEIKKLQAHSIEEINILTKDLDCIFGNFSQNSGTEISSPSALSIARWAYIYGKDLLTFDYDYLEPNYFKNFKVKVKK